MTAGGAKEVWKNEEMAIYFHSGVVADGYLYGPHSTDYNAKNTSFRCVSWATGQVKWTREGLGLTPLIVADGKLIMTTDDGNLVVAEASPTAYKELARQGDGWRLRTVLDLPGVVQWEALHTPALGKPRLPGLERTMIRYPRSSLADGNAGT